MDWQAGLGVARHGRARHGLAGMAWHGWAWQGKARLGSAWIGRQGETVKPEAVKAMREKAGLSIAQAARCVQISERSWQRYESGDRQIPPGLVELFCMKNAMKYPPN